MTERINNTPEFPYDPFTARMAMGHGVKGRPSGQITYEELVTMATRLTGDEQRFDWPQVIKQDAPWLLPSMLPSRNAAKQVQDGLYAALVVDIDHGSPTFEEVEKAVLAATGGPVALIHSTKSATFRTPRWRGVIPLERPISGVDYADTAKALYIRIREASKGRVDPDDAVARPGQISFLPNAPDGDPVAEDYLAYAAEIGDDPDIALDLTDDHPIILLRDAQRSKARGNAEAAVEQAKHRRGGGNTPISRFNAEHTIDALLRRYGYVQQTDPSGKYGTDHWRSPYQTSGSFATWVDSDKGGEGSNGWISLSGSDAKRALGAKSASGGARYGDAFDLYVHFEHGGDMGAALEAWKTLRNERQLVEVARGLATKRDLLARQRDQLRALGRDRT